ncbi:MAG: hypothetical protein FJX33_08740 [Alphaproteobacteria bacterium]|nr:hypothetical protein [Alphaproteobacteria bacterium]
MIQAFAIWAFRSAGRAACALWALAYISSAAFVQSAAYPTRPMRLLLGFAPGSATNVVARILQQSISEHLGQPLAAENRPGASGMIATQELVRAASDGYRLAIIVGAHAGPAALRHNMPLDPIRDMAPIRQIIHMPALVAVLAKSSVQSLQDLVALARATLSGLTYSASGPGGWQEFGVTDFGKRLGVSFVHVPYRGGGPAGEALATGDVAFSFATFASVTPMVQAGTVRGLAVSGAERSAEFPNLPTMADALGMPGYRTLDWRALAGPAGLPADRRARIAAALHHASAKPELAQRLQAAGATPAPSTPQQMEEFVRAEIAHYTELARATGIKGE